MNSLAPAVPRYVYELDARWWARLLGITTDAREV